MFDFIVGHIFMLTPVILCGGSGSRLWPLSRTHYPKQFLKLFSEQSLLQATLQRLQTVTTNPPIVICHQSHRFIVAEQLQTLNIQARIVLEPEGRNTAPAIVTAALLAHQQDPNTILFVLPADHLLESSPTFIETIHEAAKLAHQHFITFGIQPTTAHTGYGYIIKGNSIDSPAYKIMQFTEKPDEKTAKQYLNQGNCLWNSGMFMFHTQSLLDALNRLHPKLTHACEQAIKEAVIDLDFVRLSNAFLKSTDISIDYALLEHTDNAAVIPLHTEWHDIGSWDAVWQANTKNSAQNVLQGDTLTEHVENSLIHAHHRLVAAVGLNNHVIVETEDAVLVADKSYCQDIKHIAAKLKQLSRDEAINHTKHYRPWGWYKSLVCGDRFQVKHIAVKPHETLSLQLHYHRAEHWVVVKGVAKVTCGDKTFVLRENESTYIPKQTKHRLANDTNETLEIIEIQSGEYLGEDDIVRFEDKYQRVETT